MTPMEAAYQAYRTLENAEDTPNYREDVMELLGASIAAYFDALSIEDGSDAIARNIAGQMKAIVTPDGYTAIGEQNINCILTAQACLTAWRPK